MRKMGKRCFDECTFVIFGAAGDLTKRKLLPAIYKLIKDNKLCHFAIIGVAFDKKTAQEILNAVKRFIPKADSKILKKLEESFSYLQMDFYDKEKYEELNKHIEKVEKTKKLSGNRAYYFATMPEHFITITENLDDAGIVTKHDERTSEKTWTRLVYEKPFGNDLTSSRKINRYLDQVFDEQQIYRIDHYLGKELVGNISLARFTNRIFEPLWNNEHIESVHITLSEKIGIEKRGAFYDKYGAIKDMIQSHMLQLLALTAMETPKKLTADNIRSAKAKVLKKVFVEKVSVGQYEGYRDEAKVDPTSKTETFVSAQLGIDNKRWRGVPFFLSTGKKLDKKESIIKITFKQVECLLSSCPSISNHLTIKIFPDEGLYLGLNTKIPGIANEVTPVNMDFCHNCLFGPNTPAAYETLLADMLKGDQSTFIRGDEVNASWKIVEEMIKKKGKLETYKPGSTGPKKQNNFYKKEQP